MGSGSELLRVFQPSNSCSLSPAQGWKKAMPMAFSWDGTLLSKVHQQVSTFEYPSFALQMFTVFSLYFAVGISIPSAAKRPSI